MFSVAISRSAILLLLGRDEQAPKFKKRKLLRMPKVMKQKRQLLTHIDRMFLFEKLFW